MISPNSSKFYIFLSIKHDQSNPLNGAGGFDDTSSCGVDVRSSVGDVRQKMGSGFEMWTTC